MYAHARDAHTIIDAAERVCLSLALARIGRDWLAQFLFVNKEMKLNCFAKA